jgi:hypothetical protein
MLPMLAQLRLTDLVALPEKMNKLRGKSASHFPQWQKETLRFAGKAEQQLKKIASCELRSAV